MIDDAEDKSKEKRKEKRVKMPYIIKYRQLSPPTEETGWDAVSPINISKSGICFYTMKQFQPGITFEMLVTNPVLLEERVHVATVIRSTLKRGFLYETVVSFEAMDENTRKTFYAAIEEYIRQKGEDA